MKESKSREIFMKKVFATERKSPRVQSMFHGADGRKFGFLFVGTEATIYAEDCPHPYALSVHDFRTPLKLAPMLEHVRTAFKMDPLDSAFGWLFVCFQEVQKMMKKSKSRRKACWINTPPAE